MERPAKEETRHRVLGSEVKRRSPQVSPPPQQAKTRLAGDPGAVVHNTDDLEGMVVEVEIVQWPSATQSPPGRVVEILAPENDFGVDVKIIIRNHPIPHHFPPPVLQA